jgi:flagellar biosynthesis protein FliR
MKNLLIITTTLILGLMYGFCLSLPLDYPQIAGITAVFGLTFLGTLMVYKSENYNKV